MHFSRVLRSAIAQRAVIAGSQLAITVSALLLAFGVRFEFQIPAPEQRLLVALLPYVVAVRLAMWYRFRLDRTYWKHVSVRDLVRLVAGTTAGTVVLIALLSVVGAPLHSPVPSILALEWLLVIALFASVWLSARVVHERVDSRRRPGERALIIGAGNAGEQLLRQILHDTRQPITVVGLVDDDPAKRDRSLHGIPVVGTVDELRRLAALHGATLALVAIPSATPTALRRLTQRCQEASLNIRLLPPYKDMITDDDVRISELREVRIEDLLGRDPVNLDLGPVEQDLAGRVVAITGAGGSIGSELVRQIAAFHPRKLLLIDRAESPLNSIHLELTTAHPDVQSVPVLGSITNTDRMQRVFEVHRPEYVFHAAAYKHVPMLEWNVVEGLWNNVIGTLRVARCAARNGARKFVLISTDKAVNPTSVLGVTKLIAERIALELPSLRAAATDFRVVRFGNVLGSDGSVVPLFTKQLSAGGPITVTHPEMQRYFMTIPEAAQLVLQAAALPEAAGRIALLEMGTQVRIVDLAEQMIHLAGLVPHKDIEIVFTGLRPGEKLREELLGPSEEPSPTSVDKIRLVQRNGTHGAELARQLRQLTALAAKNDEPALLRALTQFTPEYQPEPMAPTPFNRTQAVVHETVAEAHAHAQSLARANGNGRSNGNGHAHANGNGHAHVNGNGHANGNGNGHAKSLPPSGGRVAVARTILAPDRLRARST